ncbi:signal peptidase I [Fontibacillus phaseoli]|uniref:Signal peptidase I n=1 Tax=Fontibacillus phaseoli TaxID=1416533 RepID=A0A369B3U6_9BACL|nr:signal peptidase I [Fontibacillus phaseoli]RCX16209.1 signal peptidase I [Fontibacillus phaseoli]
MEPVFPSRHEEDLINNEQVNNSPAEKPVLPKKGWVTELWDMLKTVTIAFAVMLLLNVFVFNLSMVKGQSMEPTLEEQERLFVDKIVYRFTEPRAGEVVVLRDPSTGNDKKPFLVKRIVAVPGQTVEIRDHQLLVDGQSQSEPYTDTAIEDSDLAPVTLGKNEYFVMGDNRHAGRSKDSRYFGSVKKGSIVGRAEFVFWPIAKIRGL